MDEHSFKEKQNEIRINFGSILYCMRWYPVGRKKENRETVKVPIPKVPKVLKEYTVKKNLKNNVEMALKIRPKQMAGDPIMLEISITNRGEKVVRHGRLGTPYVDFRIKIVQSGGKVPFTRFGEQHCGKEKPTEFTVFAAKPIKPGESYSVTLNLSLLFDLTLPGSYSVSVETEIYPPGSPKNSTEFTMKVSGLEFEVSEPRPVIRRGPATAPAKQKPTTQPSEAK